MGLIKLFAGACIAFGTTLTLVLLGTHEYSKETAGLFKNIGDRGQI